MQTRDTIICSVCIVITVGLLIVAGMQLDSINRQRKDMNLIIDKPENIPPSIAFATVATGAFRGLLVDVLWMRADRLKEEGQFFDARQLAEWITVLQPRFAAVWEFQAWNMAYNISVAIPASQPDQRWRWVKNGYELLRDEAIGKLNIRNISVYRELARIFQHKIGGISDDAHKYYKVQLAMAMAPLLGPADNEYFDALAEAPTSFEQIAADPNVAPFIKALKSAAPEFTDNEKFVSNYLALRQNPDRFNSTAATVLEDFKDSPALEKFHVFACAAELRKTWKLDPVLMRRLNRTYGPVPFDDPNTHLPLDWRHADSHAIYWAVKGLDIVAEDQHRKLDMVETNTDRIVAHCLQDLFRNGQMYIYDVPVPIETPPDQQTDEVQVRILKEVFLSPDLRMFEPYNKSTLAIIHKYQVLEGGSLVSLQNGHRNMLRNAVLSFYQAGHRAYAQKIYSLMRKLYPQEESKNPVVDEFVKSRFYEEMKDLVINDAKEIIVFMLRDSYFRYALYDDEGAAGREHMAKEVWDYYQSKYNDSERIDLPDFKFLRYLGLVGFLNDNQYPPNLRGSLLTRMKIEKPELFKQLLGEEEKIQRQQQTE